MGWRSITLVCVLATAAIAVIAYLMSSNKPHGSVYCNLATSEWECELTNWDVEPPSCDSSGYALVVSRRETVFSKVSKAFGVLRSYNCPPPPLVTGDPDALPVLMELIKSPDPKARRIAIEGIRRIGDRAEIAAPLLAAALDDSDSEVSSEAAIVLMKWDEQLVVRWLEGER